MCSYGKAMQVEPLKAVVASSEKKTKTFPLSYILINDPIIKMFYVLLCITHSESL